mmetsp:Transcript_27129/g.55787  ORF Transcript_27129/g.55787 Transcript_27129/m.55787 type:complete len:153 (+) Transcript_27129:107-565(+)
MSYGMNENQNYFMEGSKTTSRVTNAPGGRSSINLSWDSPKGLSRSDADDKGGNRTNSNHNDQKIVVPDEIMQVVGTAASMSQQRNNSSMVSISGNDKMRKDSTESIGSSIGSSVSSNQFALGSRMNSGNVLTDRPSSRVTQPPGGRSSICFY